MAVERLVHLWNGRWGRLGRRDIWCEQLPDGRFEVTWVGGDFDADHPGRLTTATMEVALDAVQRLVQGAPGDWRPMPAG